MADNHYDSDSDDSINQVAPYYVDISSDSDNEMENPQDEISDLEDAPLADNETPPESPILVDPYINPNNIREWNIDMGWPSYEQPPFETRDFPITREPPHHTMPVLLTRLAELESTLEAVQYKILSLASQGSVSTNRENIRNMREDFDGFTELYNHNAAILDNLDEDHLDLVQNLRENNVINNNNDPSLFARIQEMERTIANLKAQLPSTSGNKRNRATSP